MSLSWNTNSEDKQSYSNVAGMTHLLPAAVQIKWGMKEGKVCDWDCHFLSQGILETQLICLNEISSWLYLLFSRAHTYRYCVNSAQIKH